MMLFSYPRESVQQSLADRDARFDAQDSTLSSPRNRAVRRIVAPVLLCGLLLASIEAPGQSPESTPPAALSAPRLLFIGNSFTSVNNVPRIIEEIARANGQTLSVATHAPGGRALQTHWEEGRAAELIGQGGWDIVVLQDQSYRPVADPANTREYAERFAALIDQSSPRARKVLFNTWAYDETVVRAQGAQSAAEMQERLNAGYCAAARAIGGELAPVGEVWRRARTERPQLELYAGDGRHAGAVGSYLAAVVLHATLFGQVASHLPGELTLPHDPNDASPKSLTLRISAEDRALIAAQATSVLAQPFDCSSEVR